MATSESKDSYVFKGANKSRGYEDDGTDMLILSGTYDAPERVMRLNGEPLELSEEELTQLREDGWKIWKSDQTEDNEESEQPEEEAAVPDPPETKVLKPAPKKAAKGNDNNDDNAADNSGSNN